jgi:hypothetical protein
MDNEQFLSDSPAWLFFLVENPKNVAFFNAFVFCYDKCQENSSFRPGCEDSVIYVKSVCNRKLARKACYLAGKYSYAGILKCCYDCNGW